MKRRGDPITTEDYRSATWSIITFAVQHEHFVEEIRALPRNENLKRNSTIIKLTPFIDENGLLIVGGRLKMQN